MKETAGTPMPDDAAALCERARLACEEARRLASDRQFILSWYQIRPRNGALLRHTLLDE